MGIVATVINAIIDDESLESLKEQAIKDWISLTPEEEALYKHITDQLFGVKIEPYVEENDSSYDMDDSYCEGY